jgi:hypothetical protein
MRKLTFKLTLAVLATLLSSCGATAQHNQTANSPSPSVTSIQAGIYFADEVANGQTIRLSVGSNLNVTLNSTYWQLQPLSGSVLVASADPVVKPGKCLPGVGCGTVSQTYLASTPGTATITATRASCGEAMRCMPWESNYRLTVLVVATASSS